MERCAENIEFIMATYLQKSKPWSERSRKMKMQIEQKLERVTKNILFRSIG